MSSNEIVSNKKVGRNEIEKWIPGIKDSIIKHTGFSDYGNSCVRSFTPFHSPSLFLKLSIRRNPSHEKTHCTSRSSFPFITGSHDIGIKRLYCRKVIFETVQKPV